MVVVPVVPIVDGVEKSLKNASAESGMILL